jgi:hypothetical protein
MTDENAAHEPEKLVDTQPGPVTPGGSHEIELVTASHPTDAVETNSDKPKWTDKTVAFFTLALFLAALIQGYIFYKQWQEMHSGGADTHDLAVAAKAQAEASDTQAKEATAQVDKLVESLKKTDALIAEATTQANATSQQAVATNVLAKQAQRSADYAQQAIKTSVEAERPWIGVGNFAVSNFLEGQTAKITVNFVNSGKRPASASAFYNAQVVKDLPMYPSFTGIPPSVAFVLPGASFGTVFDFDLPKNAFSEWKKNKESFFFLAEIVYTDIGTNTSHITHYCAYFSPDNKNQPFPLCTRYNEAK